MNFMPASTTGRPAGVGRNFELSQILAPLAPYRDRMVVVSGLTQPGRNAGTTAPAAITRAARARGSPACIPSRPKAPTCAPASRPIRLRPRCSARTRALPSLELAIDLNFLVGNCENSYSCAYLNTLAWRSPTTPLPMENNPRVVFERLFGDGGSTDAARRTGAANRSILDSVHRRSRTAAAPARAGGPRAGERVSRRRARDRAPHPGGRGSAATRAADARPAPGIPERFDEHVKLMFELQWLAFQADITRVVTFMLGRELNFRTYPEIGITEGHHGLSHHADRPEQIAKYAKVNIYQARALRRGSSRGSRHARGRRHAARSLVVPLRRRPEQSRTRTPTATCRWP